jgi:hypothetical protein
VAFLSGGVIYVTAIADGMGNEGDLAQSTESKQPVLLTSAYGQLNAMEFDGSNDELFSASNFVPPTTMVFICESSAPSGGRPFSTRAEADTGGLGDWWSVRTEDSSGATTGFQTTINNGFRRKTASQFDLSTARIFCVTQPSGSNGSISIDGEFQTMGSGASTATPSTTAGFFFGSRGGAAYWVGKLAALLIYKGAALATSDQKIADMIALIEELRTPLPDAFDLRFGGENLLWTDTGGSNQLTFGTA